MAGTTGLEPAASAVTGQRSNQLNYVPTRQISEIRNRQCLCGFAQAYIAQIAQAIRIAPISAEPPINFGDFMLLRYVQNAPHRLLRAIQISDNLGHSREQNLSRGLAQGHLNSFPQNTKG